MSIEDHHITAPDGADHLDGSARETLDRENWEYAQYATVHDAFLAAEFRDIHADPDGLTEARVRAVWDIVVNLDEVR